MIVSCPACSARYRIDKSKIKGRGAKITCPRCSHKFVVYKDKDNQEKPIETRVFRKLGVTWKVKKGLGVIQTFHSLSELNEMIKQNQVSKNDTISYDNRTWIPLHSIENISGFFTEIWKQAQLGELKIADDSDEEDIDEENDDPTAIIKDRSALMDQLRQGLDDTPIPQSTPSPVYRTRSRSTRPSYLDDEPSLGGQAGYKEEVVGVQDPSHVQDAPPEKPAEGEPPPTPQDEGMNPNFVLSLVVFVGVILVLGLLVALDVNIPFIDSAPNNNSAPKIESSTKPAPPSIESDSPPETTEKEGQATEGEEEIPATEGAPTLDGEPDPSEGEGDTVESKEQESPAPDAPAEIPTGEKKEEPAKAEEAEKETSAAPAPSAPDSPDETGASSAPNDTPGEPAETPSPPKEASAPKETTPSTPPPTGEMDNLPGDLP